MSETGESDRTGIVARAATAADLALGDIEPGQAFSVEQCFDSDAVDNFAALSGDYSPLHIDADYAAGTEFGNRVVPGILLASLFSNLVGMQIPGRKALYLGQDLSFRRPVVIGERVTATARVTSINPALGVIQLSMSITKSDGSIAVTGAGKVKVRQSPTVVSDRKHAKADAIQPDGRRVALVTGASRGIGAAIAHRLAADGFDVAVNYRSSAREAARVVAAIRDNGHRAQAFQADVRDASMVTGMLAQVYDSFGGLDLLVNNASPGYGHRPALETEWSSVEEQLDTSVRAPLTLCQASFAMLKQRRGNIVNILSQVVDGGPPPQVLDYVIGKYGLLGLTRSLAVEWAGDGIRVNGVAPGLVETDMTSHLNDRIFKLDASRTPLRRLATPEDVAATVSFLAGRDAAFITGLVLSVTGGQVIK